MKILILGSKVAFKYIAEFCFYIVDCELTLPIENTLDPLSTTTVTITTDNSNILGSSVTFYLWSLQELTMFFSDDVLSRVADWYDMEDCDSTGTQALRYQSAKVSVWATFYNEEAGVNFTADVTTFVHEVSVKNTCAIPCCAKV